MLHHLLNLTRPLFVVDCETTGLDHHARIVELGFQQWTNQGMMREWRCVFNPGVPLGASSEIHHIQESDVVGRPRFAQIAVSLAKGFTDCDFAGKNVRFDLNRLAYEMEVAKVPWSFAGARIVDIDRLEALAIPRDLSALHARYLGRPHDEAHTAMADIQASTKVLIAQLVTHLQLPHDLDDLHAAQWPGWLTGDGKFQMVNGVATVMFGKHRGRSMRDVPTSYYDWILSGDFPTDVKALAAEAKLGRFPQ